MLIINCKIKDHFDRVTKQVNIFNNSRRKNPKVTALYSQIKNIYDKISSQGFDDAYNNAAMQVTTMNDTNTTDTVDKKLTALISEAQKYKADLKDGLNKIKADIEKTKNIIEKAKMKKALATLECQYKNIKIINKSYKDFSKDAGVYTQKSFDNLVKYITEQFNSACDSCTEALYLLNSDSFVKRHSLKISKYIKDATKLLNDGAKHSINYSINQIYVINNKKNEFYFLDINDFDKICQNTDKYVPKITVNESEMKSSRKIKKKLEEINSTIKKCLDKAINENKSFYEKYGYSGLAKYITQLRFYVAFTQKNSAEKFKKIDKVFGDSDFNKRGEKIEKAGKIATAVAVPGVVLGAALLLPVGLVLPYFLLLVCLGICSLCKPIVLATIVGAFVVLLGVGIGLTIYGKHKKNKKPPESPLLYKR